MLGARAVTDETVFSSGLPALEKSEDQQFAKDVNKKLLDYEKLWEMIEFMNVLYVPHYEVSLEWRENAEKPLRENGEGMSQEQIREFVHYFWRSVHPAIHIKNLSRDSEHTHQVAIISDDHSIVEVLKPSEVAQKYP
jgi:D-glycerate 3-kinase